MAKDGTMRGGARVGSGRKSKALTEKIDSGLAAKALCGSTLLKIFQHFGSIKSRINMFTMGRGMGKSIKIIAIQLKKRRLR
jgi:hypothetical protein